MTFDMAMAIRSKQDEESDEEITFEDILPQLGLGNSSFCAVSKISRSRAWSAKFSTEKSSLDQTESENHHTVET